MNLNRAKTILIIAFVGLNIFLSYYLFWPNFGRLTRVAVTAEDLRETENLLNSNNYQLEASLHRTVQSRDFLTVSPAVNYQNMREKSLIEDGSIVRNIENSKEFIKADEVTFIHSNGLIHTFFEPGIFLAENITGLEQREIRSKVETFLREKEIMPEGASFDFFKISEEDQEVVMHYYQLFNSIPVYSGQMEITIITDHIKEIKVFWLEAQRDEPYREMEVISATEAMKSLVKELGPSSEPKKIVQIELGYFSGEFEAEKWEIPPVWRVMFDDYQAYYINAFTGNFEQEVLIPEQLL